MMLMYHLVPRNPEQFGDVLLFAQNDEPLEELPDWKEYKEDHEPVGKYRLVTETCNALLPSCVEN